MGLLGQNLFPSYVARGGDAVFYSCFGDWFFPFLGELESSQELYLNFWQDANETLLEEMEKLP